MTIVKLLDAILHLVMVKRAERLATAADYIKRGLVWTRNLESKLDNSALPSSSTVVRVMECGGGPHIVAWTQRSCTGSRWQETEICCGHSITAIKRLPRKGSAFEPFFSVSLTTATWEKYDAAALDSVVIDRITIVKLSTASPRGSHATGSERKDSARRILAVLAFSQAREPRADRHAPIDSN